MKLISKKILNKKYTKFDISVRKNANFIANGIVVHNSNSRFIYQNGKLHVGTHHRWLRERFADENKHKYQLSKSKWKSFWNKLGFYKPIETESQSTWWQMARKYNLNSVVSGLSLVPDYMFIGEVFGNRVNILKYFDDKKLELSFYDIYDTLEGRYLDWDEVVNNLNYLNLPIVPVLYRGPFSSYEELKELAHNGTKIPGASGMAEGWIIKPVKERWNDKVGRVILKYKTDEYLAL